MIFALTDGTWVTEKILELDLEQMITVGSVEEDSGRYFVKGARERRIALEYDQAVALMKESLEEKNYGSSLKAGEIFVRLGGYKDSAHLAAECRMISQQLKREEEAR